MAISVHGVITALGNAAYYELHDLAGVSETKLQAAFDRIVSEYGGACPFMVFEVGDGGVGYTDQASPGNIPRSQLQWRKAQIVASVVTGKPRDALDGDPGLPVGDLEVAGREWYERVPAAFLKHKRLFGYMGRDALQYLWVDAGRPGMLLLSDGWYMTVEFDITARWDSTVTLSD